MFREQQRLRPASTGGGGGQRHEAAAARRSSWQQQQHQHQRVPIFGLPNQSHQLDQLDLDDREEDELIRLGQDEEEEEGDWRRAAQMLTEHDERRLLSNRQPRSSDVLDMVAPINRRLQQANQRARRSVTPTTESPSRSSSQQQQQQQQVPSSRKLAQRMVFTSHKQLTSSSAGGKAKQKKQRGRRVDNEDDEEEDNERRKLQEDQDDNSSLSFAQSGCHSILSAWRIKAANRAARLAATSRASSSQQQPTQSGQHASSERPQSVLSQASSVGRKSAASTAYTARSSRLPAAQIARIPLGPKSAQHFVTNTRRRRRANELIMNTLEARRRALSLNRSNLASSLFGSESYLGGNPPVGVDDYQRLSMSPSPLANNQQLARQSPNPFTSAAGRPAALSDLGGGRQSPAMLAQRNKLLAAAAAARHQQPSQQVASRTKTGGSNLSANKKTLSHSSLGSASGRPPPLAKLDQNSSDLCSSNDSSSGRDDDEGDGDEDSDGSQFTQLVTSELTPSCLLLEQSVSAGRRQLARPRVQSPVVRPQVPPPRPPERTKRKQVENQLNSPQVPAQQHQQQVSTSEEDDKNGNKLRRGALKRDSIRRLRLNRQQRSREESDEQQYATTNKSQSRPVTPTNQSSSRYDDMRQREREREHEELASKHLRPLSKARKLDIENNPFLNRHHFRTLSTRSTDSKQSYASQQQQVASRRTPLASVMQSSNEDEPAAERQLRPTIFRRGASARAATGSHVPEDTDLQMPRVDMENVRQVERMLRNMKPNEAVKSGRRELSTGQQVATSRSSREPRPTGGAPPVETERKPDENVFKTTTRLVRAEGARSSDDVKFDLTGNRQQRQVDERWRHERTVPMRLADGSVFSEQRFLSDRVERVVQSDRLTATTGRSISPPAEFSDIKPRTAPPVVERSVYSSQARQVSAPPPPSKFVPTPPPRPSDRYGDRPQVDENRFVAPTKPSRARSEERPKQPPVTNPEQQRQQLRHRPPVVPRASKPSTTASRSSEPPKQFALDQTAKVVRASLPQFERTADDEFRKRVDQLRQMARANLEASEQRQAQEARARRDKMKLVKPMSTNWSGPATDRPKSPNANDEGPLTSKNLLTTSSPPPATRREVRATDLDDMLLADRYQRPLRRTPSPTAPLARPTTTTTWRRSNSSLASLSGGGGAVARASQPARPASPAFGLPKQQVGSERAISPPSSVLSVEPRGDHSSATPMRVVVREKAAPRLDFAKVEQRPPVQHVRPAATAPPPPVRATHRQQAPAQQQQHQRQEASPSGPSPQRDQRLRRPEATSYSRSPEFGQAAASSNDDSAIASSVSSPSPLSSYVVSQPQRPAGLQQQVATAGQSNRAQPPVVVGAQPPSTTPMPAARPLLVATTTSANGGALQSILRRQQLAAASSFPQPTSGRLTPTSPIGRGPTPPTFMQQQQQQQQAPMRQPQAQPETASQMRQMPPTSQQQSLPAKRVHFNDRTSIRSFESISSEDSNTTAIQQHQSSNLDDLRQQVGSPDSMGSGSTSRLSNDSPAFGGEFRRGGGGGAAIYAIRGDPELEQPTVGQQQQQQHPVTTVQPPRQFHQPMVAPQQPQQQFYPSQQQQQQQPAQPPPASHQTRPMMIMQPRVQYGQPPPQARPTGGYNPTAAMHQPQVLAQLSPQHHQQQLSPLAGSIRMTAPPTIKTNPQVPSSSSYQMMSPISGLMSPTAHQQLQSPYMSRPQHSPVVVMVAPQQQQQGYGSLSAGRPAHLVTEADEEDPDYALRLRQAATRRAFNYVQPQQISPRQQPPNASGNTGGGGGGGSGQVGVPGSRRQRTDLANFQTEV